MRFHLIDRIDAYEPLRSVRGRKLTSRSEEYWEETAGGLIMPPPLVLEALCQAGTWLIMLSTERRKRAALLSIGDVCFLGEVQPGDVLHLEGDVTSFTDEVAVLSGRALVGATAVLEAQEIMCALIDSSDLEDLEGITRMERLLVQRGGA